MKVWPDIVMAYIAMAYESMACIVMASILVAHEGMARQPGPAQVVVALSAASAAPLARVPTWSAHIYRP